MSTNYKIGVHIESSGVRAATSDLARADASMNKFGKTAKDIFTSFAGNSIADAVLKVTSVAASGGAAIVKYSANLEQTAIGFESVLGSAEKAQKTLKDLAAFSKTTPFTFEGLQPIAQRLLGANIEAEKLIPLMRDIGNVTAATGKTSVERLEGIGVAITQIISKGKVSAEEMEQLAERGIPAWNILSQAIGKSVAETRKLAEDGRISADVMVQALQRIAREKYGDAMAKQAETGAGAFTRIQDTILQASATMFDPYYKEVSRIASNTAKEIDKQNGDLNKIGVTMAKSVAELFGSTLRTLLNDAYDTVVADLNGKSAIYTPQQFGEDIGKAFLGDNPNLREGAGDFFFDKNQGIKYVQGITAEQKRAIRLGKEMNAVISEGGRLINDIPLKFRENFQPLSREGNIVRGLDTITNTIKEIRIEAEKSPLISLGKGLDDSKKKAKELKDELKAASQTFNAESLKAFTLSRGFKPGAGFNKGEGHNTGSLHPLNRALDVKVGASDPNKTVDELVKFMADAIKAGIRVVDERIRPPGQKKYGGPNIHLEENDRRGSFFNPALDYAGQLEYLKALDKERLANKGTKSISAALDPENARRAAKELSDRLERERELRVRSREQADAAVLEIERATTSQTQAAYENMFARRQITESEYAEYSVQAQVDLLEREKAILEERSRLAELSADDRLEIEQRIAVLSLGIQQTVVEGQTKAIRAFEDATEAFARELEDFEITGYEKLLDVTKRLRDASEGAAEAQFNLRKATLENATVQPGGNVAAADAFARLERERLLAVLDSNRERLKVERDGELERVKGVRDEADLKAKINEAYRLKELGLEADYQAKLLEIAKITKDKRIAAAQQDRLDKNPFGQTIRSGVQDTTGLASLDESIGRATTDAEARSAAIKSVYQDLGATVVDVFSSIASATQNMLENFILTGEGGAAVFAQLAASIIASIAVQAGVKAIFEVAEGFAAAARYDFVAATGHFTAAKIYGGVAVGAAAVGIGIGLAGGLQGGKGGGKSQSDQPDYQTAKSSNVSTSGNPNIRQTNGNISTDPTTAKLINRIQALGDTMEAMNSKITGMKPGDVLARGANERKGFLTQTVTNELKSNPTAKRKLGETMNLS